MQNNSKQNKTKIIHLAKSSFWKIWNIKTFKISPKKCFLGRWERTGGSLSKGGQGEGGKAEQWETFQKKLDFHSPKYFFGKTSENCWPNSKGAACTLRNWELTKCHIAESEQFAIPKRCVTSPAAKNGFQNIMQKKVCTPNPTAGTTWWCLGLGTPQTGTWPTRTHMSLDAHSTPFKCSAVAPTRK